MDVAGFLLGSASKYRTHMHKYPSMYYIHSGRLRLVVVRGLHLRMPQGASMRRIIVSLLFLCQIGSRESYGIHGLKMSGPVLRKRRCRAYARQHAVSRPGGSMWRFCSPDVSWTVRALKTAHVIMTRSVAREQA